MTDRAKKRWRLSTQAAVLLGGAVLVVLSVAVGKDGSVNAQVSAEGRGQGATKAETVDAVTYSRVQKVRQSAGLTAEDMATLDVSGEQAEAVLGNLLAWTEQNASRIESADRVVVQAERELRETQRRIAVGPRDEQLIRGYAEQADAATTARQQRLTLHQEAARQALASVRGDQRTTWEAVHARADASGRAKRLSASDQELLKDYTAAKQGRAVDVKGEAVAENTRTQSLRQARSTRLPGVLSAESKVLPVPQELVETYAIDPTPNP